MAGRNMATGRGYGEMKTRREVMGRVERGDGKEVGRQGGGKGWLVDVQ